MSLQQTFDNLIEEGTALNTKCGSLLLKKSVYQYKVRGYYQTLNEMMPDSADTLGKLILSAKKHKEDVFYNIMMREAGLTNLLAKR